MPGFSSSSTFGSLAVVGAVCVLSLVASPAVALAPTSGTVAGATSQVDARSGTLTGMAELQPGVDGEPPTVEWGTPYAYQFAVAGPDTTVAVVGRRILPPGLTLSPDGLLTGTLEPSAAWATEFPVEVLAKNGHGWTTSVFTITIDPVPAHYYPMVSGEPLSVGWGTPYEHQLALTGPDTTVQVVGDDPLPPGLALSPSGLLSGTTSSRWAAPSYTFDLEATNEFGSSGPRPFTIHLAPELVPDVSSAPLPAPYYGKQYSHEFQLEGPGTKTVRVASGSLPPGLTLSPAGVITGTLTVARANSYTFELVAENEYTESPPRSFTISVGSRSIRQQVVDVTLSSNGKTSKMSFSCPPEAPYLVDHQFAPTVQQVPQGVEVWSSFRNYDSSTWVLFRGYAHQLDGYKSGVWDLTISNKTASTYSATVWLNCTNDGANAAKFG